MVAGVRGNLRSRRKPRRLSCGTSSIPPSPTPPPISLLFHDRSNYSKPKPCPLGQNISSPRLILPVLARLTMWSPPLIQTHAAVQLVCDGQIQICWPQGKKVMKSPFLCPISIIFQSKPSWRRRLDLRAPGKEASPRDLSKSRIRSGPDRLVPSAVK